MRITGSFIFIGIFLMLATGGYFIYRNHDASMLAATSQDHESLSRGFANSLWKMHGYKLLPIMASGEDVSDNMDVAVFAADVASYFTGMHLDSVQIYSPQKQPVVLFAEKPDTKIIAPATMLLDKALASKKPESMVAEGSIITAVPLVKNGEAELLLLLANNVKDENTLFIIELAALLGAVLLMALAIFMIGNINIRNAENLISRQYEENAELLTQANLAREENKQKSQFLANITHELRTPLNAIIGFSDILRNEFIPAPGQSNHTNYIQDIHSAGTHLLSLINDILDYSKAEAGKLELEVTEVNIVKMIQNCIRLVQPRAEMGQVRVLDSLPKSPLIMMTDGKKFKQILLNLLSNAVKFTPPNGSVQVSVWEDLQEDLWVFEVRDSGIGIAPKDISRAMAPFGQVDSALSRKFEGTGLGLPLTKKFVELMGGTFAINSEPEKGTTVTFCLPREFKAPDGVIVKQVA